MKPKILLDLDGTVADFYTGFSTFLDANYGTTLGFSDEPAGYNFEDWGGGVDGINIKQATAAWVKQGGYKDMELYPKAKDFVDSLKSLFDIWIVTARSGETGKFTPEIELKTKTDTEQWIKRHFDLDRVFFTHNKTNFCQNHGISIMVEDKLSTAIDGAKNGIKTVLMDRAWNDSPPRLNIYRAFDYDEAIKYLRKLQGV